MKGYIKIKELATTIAISVSGVTGVNNLLRLK